LGVGFFLGNADMNKDPLPTLLPVHATYRMIKDQAPWNDDLTSLGLPLQPVRAMQVSVTGSEGQLLMAQYPGPYGSNPTLFQANLPGGTYERTLAPDPPYDAVFGPEVRNVVVSAGTATTNELIEFDQVQKFDVTWAEGPPPPILPTFDIDI
jgi:hypothetical protein